VRDPVEPEDDVDLLEVARVAAVAGLVLAAFEVGGAARRKFPEPSRRQLDQCIVIRSARPRLWTRSTEPRIERPSACAG